jgi:hypothetical protein
MSEGALWRPFNSQKRKGVDSRQVLTVHMRQLRRETQRHNQHDCDVDFDDYNAPDRDFNHRPAALS